MSATPERRERKAWNADIGGKNVYVNQGHVFHGGRLFYPWINGCGIGPGSKTLWEAKEFAIAYAKRDLEIEKSKLIDRLVIIQTALRNGAAHER